MTVTLPQPARSGTITVVTDGVAEATQGWDFFVSYTAADRSWAEWIAWQLEAAGYLVLVQAWDMVPGSNWLHRLHNGVRLGSRVIAVVSPAYAESVFGAAEWRAFWRKDPTGRKRLVIPVRVADCERPSFLAGVVGIDVFGVSEDIATQRLAEAVTYAVAGRAKPESAPGFPGQPLATEPREAVGRPLFPRDPPTSPRGRSANSCQVERLAPTRRDSSSELPAPLSPVGPPHPVAVPRSATIDAEPGWWRSGSDYLRGMVRTLAPAGLVGRDGELAELHRFCAGSDRSMWWRGEVWSGKTALLATLVMNPPPGTEVLGFFVNSRINHGNVASFSRWTFEQLWALLGRPGSPPVGADADPLLLPRTLNEANTLVAGYGRRLVLVVDGLDEDLGPVSWPRQPSIASLLPTLADDGTAVICAGRSTVDLPADVDRSHAFWNTGLAELERSPHVKELQARAEAEIDQIVSISGAPEPMHRSRELVGLITAASGGLTTLDLEHLTGWAHAEVRTVLRGLAGRVLTSSDLDGATTHFFAHDLLLTGALEGFGLALGTYRDQIHTWASLYDGRIEHTEPWPETTPTYLRFGYPQMLISSQDQRRLTLLASDPARQRLLLDTLGGDAASLTEVTAALGMHAATCDPESAAAPDLVALFRLARRRDLLDGRTARLPVSLPAAWASLGEQARGQALAASFVDADRRAEAQHELKEGFRRPSPRPRSWQDPVLQAVADSGLRPRRDAPPDGLSAALRIADPRRRLEALAALSMAASQHGRAAEAADLARAAGQLIDGVRQYERTDAMVDVLDALLAAGERERAVALTRDWTNQADPTDEVAFDAFLPVLLRTEPAGEVLKRAHRAEGSTQDEESRRYRRRALSPDPPMNGRPHSGHENADAL